MDTAYRDDAKSNKEGRPGLEKIKMLSDVVEAMGRSEVSPHGRLIL